MKNNSRGFKITSTKPGEASTLLGFAIRTGDELRWREFMKKIHGGFVALRNERGEHILGRDRAYLQ